MISLDNDFALIEINAQATINAQNSFTGLRDAVDAPQYRFSAADHLTSTKRLRDVVVSTKLKPSNFIFFLTSCCEHNNGYVRKLAKHPQSLKPVELWHHD